MNEQYQFWENPGIWLKDPDEDTLLAAQFLQEEIALRSNKTISIEKKEIQADLKIVFAREEGLGSEVCKINRSDDEIAILADDKRGFLYGAAALLRKMYLKNGRIGISKQLQSRRIVPSYPMRGHQLAYRDKQNTLPAWTEKDFERYIRELLIFGSNAIEIMPPRTDDNLFSVHFKKDPFEMMIALSKIIHSYGMEVHMWYPYLSHSDEGELFEMEMKEREKIFSAIPYLDGVLIPAGDPGELPPKKMIKAAEGAVKILHKYHPEAKVWVAPQSFSPDETWYPDFYEEIEKEPDWLYGVCFGPWVKDTIEEMYEKLPEKYRGRIRHYPDITHNMGSQYEMPDWDEAFSYTLGRESYNARPKAFLKIHEKHRDYCMGSITYSEGIHDDVNKIIWGNLDYCKEEAAESTVRDYVRLLIDPDLTDELTEIIMGVEENWKGSILENQNIDLLYEKMQKLEAEESTKNNYRYQLLLLRVLGDYQTKLRYKHDQELEAEAYEILRGEITDSRSTIQKVREILYKTYTEPAGVEERYRLQKLADSLFRNCGIQLTSTRHKGQGTSRGAWLDTLDMALNDYQWITCKLRQIEKLPAEEERKAELKKMAFRCDPGEGGRYLNLGSPKGFSYVEKTLSWENDPGFLRSPLMAHQTWMIVRMYRQIGWYDEIPISTKYLHGARTIYGTPLVVNIPDLDPQKQYELTVTYPELLNGGRKNLRLYAGEELIHEVLTGKDGNEEPCYTFALPVSAYQDGRLRLTWQSYAPLGACLVSEVWIRVKQ